MGDLWKEHCIISPSVICLDMCNLENQIKLLEENRIRALHVDILDGYFSPSMPLGLDTVRQLRKKTNLEFDCHVMVKHSDFFVNELLDIGVQQIVFHAETEEHMDGMLNYIRSKNVRAGIALKPGTSLSCLEYVLDKCDTVLLMLINPGYAFVEGEKQVSYAERKICDLRKMIDDRGLDTKVEIDGRVSVDDIRKYNSMGVNIFVAGSTCIKPDSMKMDLQNLMNLCNNTIK